MTRSCSAQPWGHCRFGVRALRARGLTGAGVRVGHLDTGIDAKHIAFEQQAVTFRAWSYGGAPLSEAAPADERGHGTQTAAILAGGAGVGVAPGCSLFCGQVFEGGDVILRLLRGLVWLAEERVQVVCLPAGVPGSTPVFDAILAALRQRGTLVVCAAGNGGVGAALSPGDSREVLAVGAVDGLLQVPEFSASTHPFGGGGCLRPDLVAPGVDVPTAVAGSEDRFETVSGTSAACSFVAGVAALLMEAARDAGPDEVGSALTATARSIGGKAPRVRAGAVEPEAALEHLLDLNREGAPRWPFAPALDGLVMCERYVDPRLELLCAHAREDETLRAIVGMPDSDGVRSPEALRSLVRSVGGAEADSVDCEMLPLAQVGVVRAGPRFLEALMQHPGIELVSAVDADPWG